MQLILKSGDVFEAEPAPQPPIGCGGCAFEHWESCVKSDDVDHRCSEQDIIWVRRRRDALHKPELKYTVAQVLKSYSAVTTNIVDTSTINMVSNHLRLVEDEDYKTYLALKARYEP